MVVFWRIIGGICQKRFSPAFVAFQNVLKNWVLMLSPVCDVISNVTLKSPWLTFTEVVETDGKIRRKKFLPRFSLPHYLVLRECTQYFVNNEGKFKVIVSEKLLAFSFQKYCGPVLTVCVKIDRGVRCIPWAVICG